MKITDEIKIKAFAAYMPCAIKVKGEVKKLVGVDWSKHGICIAEYPDEMCESITDWLYPGNLDGGQLILKTLSEISAEHKSHCLSIIHQDNRLYGVVNFTYFDKLECHGVSVLQWMEIIEFLRSKEYDCGYGDMPSLIKSKIAIKHSDMLLNGAIETDAK